MTDDRPPLPTPAGSSVTVTRDQAESWARRWNLIDDQGQLWCMKDGCDQPGTYPSLCCAGHLAEHRRRHG